MRTINKLLFLAVSCCLFIACKNEKNDTNPATIESRPLEELITELIVQNAVALEREDIEMSMMIMDPRTDIKNSTRAATLDMFQLYDLEYRIEDVKIVQQSGDTLLVRVIQHTKTLSGPDTFNSKYILSHVFIKRPEGWKIMRSDIDTSFSQ